MTSLDNKLEESFIRYRMNWSSIDCCTGSKPLGLALQASFWSDTLEHGLNIIYFGSLTLQSERAPILRIYTNPSPIFLTLILGSRCVVQILQFPSRESVSCSPVVHSCVCGATVWAGQAWKARITRAEVPDMFIKSGRTTWFATHPELLHK